MARLSDSTVARHPSTGEPVFLPSGSEVPKWASELVGDHLLAPARHGKPDESWTVPALRAHAESNSIDLGEATKKKDILAAINASESD